MKIAVSLLLVLIVIVLILFLYTWYRFRSSVDLHVNSNQTLPSKYPLPKENVSFVTSDNIHISGWYIPVKNPKAFVILIHGYTTQNGGKALMLPHADYLYKAGYSTLLFDMRSVGESDGKRITLGVDEWKDTEAAYNYLKSRPETDGKKIGYLGISMGGSVALITAGQTGTGDFVIASVPYASFKRNFTFQVKKEGLYTPIFLPMLEFAARMEFGSDYMNYEPEKVIKKITAPLFIITAENDRDVDREDGKYLYDIANDPKEYWRADTQHDVFDEKPEEYKKKILEFLNGIVNH